MAVHVACIQILQEEIDKLESSMRTTADLVSGIGKNVMQACCLVREEQSHVTCWFPRSLLLFSAPLPPAGAGGLQHFTECLETGPCEALLCPQGSASVQRREPPGQCPPCTHAQPWSPSQSLLKPQEDLLLHVMAQPNSRDAVHSVLGMNRQVRLEGRAVTDGRLGQLCSHPLL